MFILMAIVFILGYIAIALEHPLKIDKSASALMLSVVIWVIYMIGVQDILSLNFSDSWKSFSESTEMSDLISKHPDYSLVERMRIFIVDNQIISHLGEISEILFFLLGAMTIVETIDQHQGFKIITDKITTNNKVKLLWIISILTFFMSSLLDNLTSTIVMVALLRKLIDDKQTRWFFASMIVIAANAGGAWTPIGDVTTIMLWIGKQITAGNIIMMVFIPSVFNLIVPIIIVSFMMKGEVKRPATIKSEEHSNVPLRESKLMLIMGVGTLLFVPIFKTITHLPPYMGMLFGLAVIWITTEIIHKRKDDKIKGNLKIHSILKRVDIPTVFFFLGILTAVAALQSAGQLGLLAKYLDTNLHNIYAINIIIGILSSIVDNVPLVAGTMGMYPIYTHSMIAAMADPSAQAYATHFMEDGAFWELLAYAAGTGGSILIIGSAAGVAAMGLEKIDFIWYMKKVSWLALLGYFAGIGAYWLQEIIIFHK
ncbi:MAG: sodium:proton antiporter [Bacteroidetes bacterium CG2_30_33_31]|nr:MAG: sodium:proton antiporter [Bacteroidetes bacterium CG2_30_33_31]